MNPMVIIAIPLVLVIIGMVLNSIGLSFDQPPSSAEQDPAKRAAADADTFRRFFDSQRRGAVQRQKRVGQFAWLLLIAIIGSFIWLYKYTVNSTTVATQIAVLQTLPTEDGKDTVLSVTRKDASNFKFLIKTPQGDALEAAKKEGISKEKVSTYELSQLATMLNLGETPPSPGLVLKISN